MGKSNEEFLESSKSGVGVYLMLCHSQSCIGRLSDVGGNQMDNEMIFSNFPKEGMIQ